MSNPGAHEIPPQYTFVLFGDVCTLYEQAPECQRHRVFALGRLSNDWQAAAFCPPLESRSRPSFLRQRRVGPGYVSDVKAWPTPCFLINARLAKKRAATHQGDLSIRDSSNASLRAVHVTVNEAARQDGLLMFENIRIPEVGIIYPVFRGLPYGEAVENLSSWETSNGFRLADRLVEIKAKQGWESVDALIIPRSDKRSRRPAKLRRN